MYKHNENIKSIVQYSQSFHFVSELVLWLNWSEISFTDYKGASLLTFCV